MVGGFTYLIMFPLFNRKPDIDICVLMDIYIVYHAYNADNITVCIHIIC